MPQSRLRLFKHSWEYMPMAAYSQLPSGLRGLYVLFEISGPHFNVVYIGLAGLTEKSGIRGRLKRHRAKKKGRWTHFSAFEVHDNVSGHEIRELEGLLRHVYRDDEVANRLNKARGFNGFRHPDVRLAHRGKWTKRKD